MNHRVWSGVLSELLGLVDYRYARGTDLDTDYFDPDSINSLEAAEPVSRLLGRHGVSVPDTDTQLIGYLSRHGQHNVRGGWWRLVATGDGRVGVTCPHGVIESAGGQMALVLDPGPGRYDRWFSIPGVWYLEGHAAAERAGGGAQ